MGESAGANSVAIHLVSPLSCGLLNKAILQSAGLDNRWAHVDAETAQERSGEGSDLRTYVGEDTICAREFKNIFLQLDYRC